MSDFAKPSKVSGQKGTFVGDPAEIHIHIVADNSHVTVAGDRKNFYERDLKSLQVAIDHLKAKGRPNTSGYKNCMDYLVTAAKAHKDSRANAAKKVASKTPGKSAPAKKVATRR